MNRVALESTVFAHGLPRPVGLETAAALERVVRDEGARPCTIGIVDGEVVVGLSPDQIEMLATSDDVRKASLRDLPIVCATRRNGATTVASTVTIAHRHGIEVVCTGGIGGVHRGNPFDVSNDLTVLGGTPVTLVCSGAKAILDLSATREKLETLGVTVVGYQTDDFPGFYSRSTGLPVDVVCHRADEVVDLIRSRSRLGLSSAILVCVPVPEEHEIPFSELEATIDRALRAADRASIAGAEMTPFLLEAVAEKTGGRSIAANTALLENNARVAAQIATQIG
jgi:pseudouridine-5'-phosphate glycosidase